MIVHTWSAYEQPVVTAVNMPRSLLGFLLAIGMILALAACSPKVPASVGSPVAPPGSPTLDACGVENVEAAVKPINDLMREFDDYATLAQYMVQSDLVQVIPRMQTIRRAGQDLVVPGCLVDLRRHELAYMDATLGTLLAFQTPTPNLGTLATGIADARSYHQAYAAELARILGPKLTPAAATAAARGTP